jgi:hypothetical protein
LGFAIGFKVTKRNTGIFVKTLRTPERSFVEGFIKFATNVIQQHRAETLRTRGKCGKQNNAKNHS